MVDFFRFPVSGILGYIKRIEYDPGRTAPLALVLYRNGVFSYLPLTHRLRIGSPIFTYIGTRRTKFGLSDLREVPVVTGFCVPIHLVGTGSLISLLTLGIGYRFPALFARSAGTYAQILRYREGICQLRLKSGRVFEWTKFGFCTVGKVSRRNLRRMHTRKASSRRTFGQGSRVRGVAKNPVDHPHGGGEGRSSGGRHSSSPWGFLTKGGFRKFRK